MSEEKEIVWLEISSFAGISIGATHFYGTLKGFINGEWNHVDLIHKLTRMQAIALNKRERTEYPGDKYPRVYKENELTKGFDTKDEVIAIARRKWKRKFPGASILLNCDDKSVIAKKNSG